MSLANASIPTVHSVGHHKNSFSRFVHSSENHPMYAPVPVPTTASADSRLTSYTYTTTLNTTTPTCTTTTTKDSSAQRLDHQFFAYPSSRPTRQLETPAPAPAPMVVAHISSAVTGTFVTTAPQNGIHIPFPAVKINTAVAKSVIASATTATKVHVRVGALPKPNDEDETQDEPTCGNTDLSVAGVSSGAEESEGDIRHVLAERFKTKPCRNYEEKGVCPYEHRCMFAHGPHEARTAAMNIRDGLFTEEAIKSFRRAQRVAQREAAEAARALSRQQKLQQIASEEEKDRHRARPQGAPLPPPPSYDCALNASPLYSMGKANSFGGTTPVIHNQQHAAVKGTNGSSSSSDSSDSNPVSLLNLNGGHAHHQHCAETTTADQQQHSCLYEEQQQQYGAEQYGDGSSLCGDEDEYEEDHTNTNGEDAFGSSSVPLRSLAYDPFLFLTAGHQHEFQVPTSAPPAVYRRNPYSIVSVYRPLAAGSSRVVSGSETSAPMIKEVALVTDYLVVPANGLVMP